MSNLTPLTEQELNSFKEYATKNKREVDGTQCRWADYTLRLIAEVGALRSQRRRKERPTVADLIDREYHFVSTEDANEWDWSDFGDQ